MGNFLISLPARAIAIVILAVGLVFTALGGVLFDLGVWFLGEETVERLLNGDDK